MRMARKFPCIAALGLLGFLASCSDPVPPASQGSASIHFNGPNMADAAAGKMCPPGTHWANAPTAQTADQQTTGATRPKDTIKDGEQGRDFKCSVVASGDKFAVSGTMKVPAFDKDMKQLPLPTQIQITRLTIGKGESGATGSLSVADFPSAGNFYQSQSSDCVFSVQSDPTTNKMLAVDAGKIWGKVTCPSVNDPSDPSSSCAIDLGYFILENCDQ